MSQAMYSIKDITDALGRDPSRIKRRAKKEHWQYEEVSVRGGKQRQYPLTSLPQDVQQALLKTSIKKVEVRVEPENTLPTPAEERLLIQELTDAQRDVMHGRLGVLALIDELSAMNNLTRSAAIDFFIQQAATGNLPEAAMNYVRQANARSGDSRLLSRPTVFRWFQARDTQGKTALAPQKKELKDQPDWLAPLLKLYQVPQKPTVARCVRDWEKHFNQPFPSSLRTAQREIEKLPVEMREWGRMGRNARRSVQPFVRRTTDGLWPMDVVTVDGHLFKAYVKHPLTGRKVRPELTTYVDVHTRRAIGFSAWWAESSLAIWVALREMVLNPNFGIPACHYSDNGAYRSDQHRATLERIGTSPLFAQPYRAQARGLIERFNSSVWVPLAKEFDTYVGADMDKEAVRKQLKIANDQDDGRNLMPWEDFVARANEALEEYNNRRHGSLKKRTPNQVWQQSLDEGWQPTILNDDDLHDLLPSYERTVRRGEITLPWGKYFADALAAYHEQTVRVGVHPNKGDKVWISNERGALICVAERDANARQYLPDNLIEHGRFLREQGQRNRLERKLDLVLEEGSASLIEQPLASTVADREAFKLQLEAEQNAEPVPQIASPKEKFARWNRIDALLKTGEELPIEDQKFHALYQKSTEFKSMQALDEDFFLEAGRR